MAECRLPHNHGQWIEQELEEMPSVEEFQTVSEIFKQLCDGSRVRIYWLLCHCEECVINLAALVGMSSPAVSHHLRQLKASGLIVSRRVGKEVYYKAAETEQAQLLHKIIDKLVEVACPGEPGGSSAPGDLSQYSPQQVELVRSVHDFLVEHLGERYTIEELSKKYLLNTSTLKELFKAVYGQPIAAYMKEYRMERAKGLLRETEDSVAAIAQEVGYGTQGKFTQAFKEHTGALPTEYRRQFRK